MTRKEEKHTETAKTVTKPDTSGNGGTTQPGNTGLATRSWAGSPFSFMRRFSEEMDRLFEGFGGLRPSRFGDWLAEGSGGGWMPRVDAYHKDNKIFIRVDLPGMNKDDVNVEVTDDALIIQGERKQTQEENREGFYCSECSFGSFYRRIPLPEGVDAEKATANFQNGVLEVTIPAPEPQQRTRHIKIQEGTEAKV